MRLIDADTVGLTDFEIVVCEGDYKKAFKLLCEKLDSAPTVDAVEVVRCEHCIHYNAGFECLKEGYGIEYPPDYFCGDGKRKE